MDLKDFVAQTLVEIQQGVQIAIERTQELQINGVINPVWGTSTDVRETHIKEVQFDIAVTASDKSSGDMEGGIQVIGVKVGKTAAKSQESIHVSRIQFSIPIVPPVTVVGADKSPISAP